MARPRPKRPPLLDLLALADVLPRGPVGPGFRPGPPVLRAATPAVRELPVRRPRLSTRLTDIAQVLPGAVRSVPGTIARDVLEAETPGDLIRALTGFETDPRKVRTTGQRVQQGLALAGLAPLGLAGRGVRAAATEVGERAAARLTPSEMVNFLHGVRPDPLAAPAFQRAGGQVRTIGQTLGAGDLARVPERFGSLRAAIARGGEGFTLDRAGRPFRGSGYAVARPELTKELTGAPGEVEAFLARPDVQAALEKPNTYVGGWRGEINVTDIVDDQQRAVGLARRRNQKAYGEFKEGEYLGDREYIATPEVQGADGNWYPGTDHGDARENAAKALRATPEGRAAIDANGGNAIKRGYERYFKTSGGDHISANDPRSAAIARGAGQAPRLAPEYQGLHSSDLGPPKIEAPAPERSPFTRTSGGGLLLPDELQSLSARQLPTFESKRGTITTPPELLQEAILAGEPARGGYTTAARAFTEIFGPEDAPRFQALWSALSPRQPNEKSLMGALRIWDQWSRAGRRPDVIPDLVRAELKGGADLAARGKNALAALTTTDPRAIALSGAKVADFNRALGGDLDRVVMDVWARYASGTPEGHLKDVGPGYLAAASRFREALPPGWRASEGQESAWSWLRALGSRAGGTGPRGWPRTGDIAQVPLKTVTPELIRSQWDLPALLRSGPYAEQLGAMGRPLPSPWEGIIPPGTGDPRALRELAEQIQRAIGPRPGPQRSLFGF